MTDKSEQIVKGAEKPPVLFLNAEEGFITTEDSDIAKELADKVLGGILKITRAFVPTRENLEGKKEQYNVSLVNNVIFINTDTAIYLAMISIKIDELCKKRGPLRPAIAQMMHTVSADINYGILNPWIKLNSKNIRSAYIGPDGFKFVVSKGVVELNVPPTVRSNQYAEAVTARLDAIVPPDAEPKFGPFEFDFSQSLPDTDSVVLHIDTNGVTVDSRLKINQDHAQIKIKKSMLPSGKALIFAFDDPLSEGYIIRIYDDTPLYLADQYYRVLAL
jgi:hypothetical protein